MRNASQPGRPRLPRPLLRLALPIALAAIGGAGVAAASSHCRTGFQDFTVVANATEAPAAEPGTTQRWVSAPYSAAWRGPGDLPVANTTAIGYTVAMTPVSGTPPVMRTIMPPGSPQGAAVPWKSPSGAVGSAGVATGTFGPYPVNNAYKVAMAIDFDRPLQAFRFAAMDLDWTGERISRVRLYDSTGNLIRLSTLRGEARNFAEPAPSPVPELSAGAEVAAMPGVFFYQDDPKFTFDAADDSVGRPTGVGARANSSSTSVFIGLADDIGVKAIAFDYQIEGSGGPRFSFSGRDSCNSAAAVPVLDGSPRLLALSMLVMLLGGLAAARYRRNAR